MKPYVCVVRIAVGILREQIIAGKAGEHGVVLTRKTVFVEVVQAGDEIPALIGAGDLQLGGGLVGLTHFRKGDEVREQAIVIEAGLVLGVAITENQLGSDVFVERIVGRHRNVTGRIGGLCLVGLAGGVFDRVGRRSEEHT